MAEAKPKLKKKAVQTSIPTRKPEDIIEELDRLKEQKKLLESREKDLKDDLGAILEVEGAKDNKGSYKLIIGDKVAQKQARKSVKLNVERAETFFKEIGIWEEVIEVKEILNEDLVEQALNQDKFTMDDLEEITDVKTTYAIVVGKYKPEEEEMPEIKTN